MADSKLASDYARIQARILGHGRRHGRLSPVTFDIEVHTPGAEFERHIAQRRYSSFERLDEQCRPQFLGLPPLPPKSVVWKTVNPEVFMANRERDLGLFLAALLDADPTASTKEIRRFLAIGKLVASRPATGDSYCEASPSFQLLQGSTRAKNDSSAETSTRGDSDTGSTGSTESPSRSWASSRTSSRASSLGRISEVDERDLWQDSPSDSELDGRDVKAEEREAWHALLWKKE